MRTCYTLLQRHADWIYLAFGASQLTMYDKWVTSLRKTTRKENDILQNERCFLALKLE